MDSLNIYTALTEENRIERYFSSKAINNSLLKKVEKPQWIKWWEINKQVEDDDKRYFRVGRAVDTLLTDKENFSKKFFVFNQKRPSGLMGKFIDQLPLFALNEENWNEDELQKKITNGLYLRAYSYAGYKINIDTVIENFWTKGENCGYYRAREQAMGKEVLSVDEMEELEVAVKALEQLPDIREYFGRMESEEVECLYQVPIYHTVSYPDENAYFMDKESEMVMQFKGLLDLVLINHEDKTIEPIDLKTVIGDPEEFEFSFYKFGYFRQAAFYHWLMSNADGYFQDLLQSGYKMLPFKFIVAPKKEFFGQSALKFIVSEETMKLGLNGGYAQINGVQRHLRGIFEYIEAYRWHRRHDIWNVPKWVFDSNYTLTL